MLLLLTLLLGVFTYWVISRSASNLTALPLWILWTIMMLPVLTFTGWVLTTNGEPPPAPLLYGLMVLSSLVLYAALTWSRMSPKRPPSDSAGDSKTASDAQSDTQPAQATAAISEKAAQTKAQKQPQTKPITQDEETQLQRCFPWSIYYLQNIEYLPQAMICKGKLKTNPAKAYTTVQRNVEQSFGDRFLVLFQESLNGKPFFALVPNPQAKNALKALPASASPAQVARLKRLNQTPVTRPIRAFILAALTLLTTTVVGTGLIHNIEDPAILQETPSLFWSGFAYGLSLMVILGVHESGHYLATRYHKLRATLPYFIPAPFFLGTLGAFIQMRSPMPNRRALFDVGIAGPLSGLVVSLPILLWGLAHSTIVPLGETADLLNFQAVDPSRSILLLLLSKAALGSDLSSSGALSLHPLAISGCLGLIVTALNLMPVGQLDGGHIVHAMYGQRTALIVSHIARILMLLLAYVYREFLLWAFLLLFVPAAEPALNDVSELDSGRDFLGLFALTLLVLIILPAPGALRSLLF